MPELITESTIAYETRAITLARAPEIMDELKKKLSSSRLSCPLFATDLFRTDIETAYTAMWQAWQRGEAPIGFSVEPEFAKPSGR
jgi:predicted O-linked N-acetylglucosamine transferase (SPINDLY family)